MKHKISIFYSWIIRLLTSFLPNIPIFMRFRGFLYSFFMKKCGKNFQVTSSVIINSLSGLSVGDNVYIAHFTVLIGKCISIEDDVLIGPNCVISSGNHTRIGNSFRFGQSVEQDILIKSGSWIAGNCTVLAGSVLPEGSVLAAGAVLNSKNSIKNSIYGGTPAKRIKNIEEISTSEDGK